MAARATLWLALLAAAAALGARGAAAQAAGNATFTVEGRPAIIGNPLPQAGIRGILKLADPLLGCEKFAYSDRKNVWVALIQRGECEYQNKIANAEAAGAAAVIIYDRKAEDILQRIERAQEPGAPEISIPSVFTSLAGGDALLRLLRSSGGTPVGIVLEPTRITVTGVGPKMLPLMPAAGAAPPAGGRTVRLAGSSEEILAGWAAAVGGMSPGDVILLSPAGGVLEVPPGSPLDIPGPITVAGAADAPRAASAGDAGAPEGAVTIRCAKGAYEAVIIRSPGATLRGVTVEGCLHAAVAIYRPGQPATSAHGGAVYPPSRPAVLERVTLRGALGTAVLVDQGAAAALRGCAFYSNGADADDPDFNILTTAPPNFPSYPTVWARPGSNLGVAECRFSGNKDLSVLFQGDLVTVSRSAFVNNRDSGVKVRFEAPNTAMYGDRAPPAISTLHMAGCVLKGNTAKRGPGGAVVASTWAAVSINDTLFQDNTADSGGGLYLSDGALLAKMNRTRFVNNSAKAYGGAVFYYDTDCNEAVKRGAVDADANCWVQIDASQFANNTAGADGGAFFYESSTDSGLNFTRSQFNGNTARGEPDPDNAYMWYPFNRDRRPCVEPFGVQSEAWGLGGGVYVAVQSWGNVFFKHCGFARNAARVGGGGIHACAHADSGERWSMIGLLNCSMTDNTAGALGGGAAAARRSRGGALHAAGTSFETTIEGSLLARNRAGSGGAVRWDVQEGAFGAAAWWAVGMLSGHNLGVSGWPFLIWPELWGNRTRLMTKPAAVPTVIRDNVAEHGDGGGVSVESTGSAIVFINTKLLNNTARRLGGGASALCDGCKLVVAGAAAANNTAGAAGGGLLAAGDGLEATLTAARLEGNAARGPAGAGGGLFCHSNAWTRLESVVVTDNAAGGFGGGAAVVRGAGNITITSSTFERNAAPPGGGGGGGGNGGNAAARRRRGLLQYAQMPAAAGADAALAAGAAAGGAKAFLDGLDAGNVTGDDGLYPGGGGLYASSKGTVVLSKTTISDNTAMNGGGATVRTDLCTAAAAAARAAPPAKGAAAPAPGAPRCLVLGGGNTIAHNAAPGGVGGGLLVTNISAAFTACGGGALVPLQACWAGAPRNDSTALAARGLPFDNVAQDDETADLASIAARLVVVCVRGAQADGGGGDGDAAAGARPRCVAGGGGAAAAVAAPPGATLGVDVAVQDWQGSRVLSGFDSTMVLQAKAYTRGPSGGWQWRPDILVMGNQTNANGGVAEFLGLQVAAPPGEYQLRFSPLAQQHLRLAPAVLDLTLRGCVAGEANLTAQAASHDGVASLAPCQQCRPGTVSLDPQASGGCTRCDDGVHGNCTGYALVPSDGYFHSHPRSPLVHRCLLAAACQPALRQEEMQAWARAHAADSVAALAPVYQEYVEMQCAEGYEGVLCGQCRPGWGRHLQSCVPCMNPHVNGFLYFLALAWMVALITMSAVFQLNQVAQRRRRKEGERLQVAHQFASASGGGDARAAAAGSTTGPPPAGMRGASGASGPEFARLESIADQELYYPGPGPAPDAYAAYNASDLPSSFAAVPAAVMMGDDDGNVARAASVGPDAGAGGRDAGNGAAGGLAGAAGSGGLLEPQGSASRRWWSVSTDAGSNLGRAERVKRAQPMLRAPTATFDDEMTAKRARSALSGPSSLFSRAGSRRAASVSAPGGGNANGGVPAPSSAPASSRFWLSNVFKLLITHLQLLGLLRTIKMDWPSGVDKLMGAMDQTQSMSSWVVMECVFARVGGSLRPSVVRTLVMLLLPAAGAAVGCLFWACRAWYSSCRRRRVAWGDYTARFVMTLGMVMFYLYPQVSNVVVSILFACTPVDDPSAVDAAFLPLPGAPPSPGGDARAALAAVGTYWDYDTSLQCWQGPMRWLLALGVVWAVLFCAGFPVLMAVQLARKRRVRDDMADLKYGFFYDSYRRRYYYWESVILLEKLAVVVVLTATSRLGAAPQVLSAHFVMFAALLLQWRCHPYGCRMLDTLQVASLVALTGTTLALMAPALNQAMAPALGANSPQSIAVTAAALSVAGALNLAVLVAFIFALVMEGRRALIAAVDAQGKGRVTWAEAWPQLKALWRARLRGARDAAVCAVTGRKPAATVKPAPAPEPPGPPQESIYGPLPQSRGAPAGAGGPPEERAYY